MNDDIEVDIDNPSIIIANGNIQTNGYENPNSAIMENIDREIPDWIGSDDVYDTPSMREDDEQNTCLEQVSNSYRDHGSTIHPLELLGSDVSSILLSYLSLMDVCNVSLVSQAMYQACRTQELWKILFQIRWNASWWSDQEFEASLSLNFYVSYQAAFANTHDLWITHWNIVPPEDGDAPGRCCIPTTASTTIKLPKNSLDSQTSNQQLSSSYCPSCRYNNMLSTVFTEVSSSETSEWEIRTAALALEVNSPSKGSSTTRSNAIRSCTMYSIAKSFDQIQSESTSTMLTPKPKFPSKAFSLAATFHRTIDIRQYKTDSLQFLTDAIFLNVTESSLDIHTNENECQQMLDEIYGTDQCSVEYPGALNTLSNLGPAFDMTQHSWHIVRLSNPDFIRPLTFRVFLQRADAFTVFPSEGYLKPGECCFVFLGVRALGGLINQATEALNVQREEVNLLFSELYAHEAHLPLAPFCIRYMYCPVIPCIPPNFDAQLDGRRPRGTSRKRPNDIVSYMWDHFATAANLRTLYISAHVNSNYSFNEFSLDALFPFDLKIGKEWNIPPRNVPLVYVAPNLMHHFPTSFHRIQNIDLELLRSNKGNAYRTEKRCKSCGRDWGPRSEELGRRYVLQMVLSLADERKDSKQMCNFVQILRSVHSIVRNNDNKDDENWEEIYRILFVLHKHLMKHRAAQRRTITQRRILTQYECIVDQLCRIVQQKRGYRGDAIADGPMTWRNMGVYCHRRSTDSIFNPNSIVGNVQNQKEEPDYLLNFRHLCHNPGRYGLGRQEDPNHEETQQSKIPFYNPPLSKCYPQRRGIATDTFMDSDMLSFGCALAMIHDPRSLMVHGIYDRIFPPGTIARRPSLPSRYFATKENPREQSSLFQQAEQYIRLHREKEPLQPRCHVTESSFLIFLCGDKRYCSHYNDIDQDALELLTLHPDGSYLQLRSLYDDFIRNIPPPGKGRYAFSEIDVNAVRNDDEIIEMYLVFADSIESGRTDINTSPILPEIHPLDLAHNHDRLNQLFIGLPRLFLVFFHLSSRLGWNIQQNIGGSSVTVDRKILISAQWVANSAMVFPILYTLLARAAEHITYNPLDYYFEGLPFPVRNKMNFLNRKQCMWAAALIVLLWLMMGRYAERKMGRSLERSMQEHIPSYPYHQRYSLGSIMHHAGRWILRAWDRWCPAFIQRRVFTPSWNRRTSSELTQYIRLWRSKDLREHRSYFSASSGCGIMAFGSNVNNGGPPHDMQDEYLLPKAIAATLVFIGSFCAASPYFSLNLFTIFCSSIGLGMSVSLQTMESGHIFANASFNSQKQSIWKQFSLNTIIIFSFLFGHLIGSSGGIQFLAEFFITMASLTFSASAMDSWKCFFCLSTAAFWGYVFARVALLENIHGKRLAGSGVILCTSLLGVILFFIGSLVFYKWDTPTSVMIVRHMIPMNSSLNDIAESLQ